MPPAPSNVSDLIAAQSRVSPRSSATTSRTVGPPVFSMRKMLREIRFCEMHRRVKELPVDRDADRIRSTLNERALQDMIVRMWRHAEELCRFARHPRCEKQAVPGG